LLELKRCFSKKPTFVHFPLPTGLFYEKSAVSVNQLYSFPIKANTFGLVYLAEKPAKFRKHKPQNPKFRRKRFRSWKRWVGPNRIAAKPKTTVDKKSKV
jgi:hypothetical protein